MLLINFGLNTALWRRQAQGPTQARSRKCLFISGYVQHFLYVNGLCLGVCHQLIELVVVISEEKKLVFFANVCFICELKVDDLWI